MSLASRRRHLLRQAAFRHAVLRKGHAAQKCKNPTETNPAGFSILATSYSRTAYRRTTIGAAAFHCRVRNGNGWGHCATVTRAERRTFRRSALACLKFEVRRSICFVAVGAAFINQTSYILHQTFFRLVL